MKKYILDFFRRGIVACGLGPIILAVLYLILQQTGALSTITINQVCTGIFSLMALAFIAGGMNTLYQIERLPLMVAIFIHGLVLYICYLVTYLINDWLEWTAISLIVFSGIFVFGYMIIWTIIYSIVKSKTKKLNETLRKKQSMTDNKVL